MISGNRIRSRASISRQESMMDFKRSGHDSGGVRWILHWGKSSATCKQNGWLGRTNNSPRMWNSVQMAKWPLAGVCERAHFQECSIPFQFYRSAFIQLLATWEKGQKSTYKWIHLSYSRCFCLVDCDDDRKWPSDCSLFSVSSFQHIFSLFVLHGQLVIYLHAFTHESHSETLNSGHYRNTNKYKAWKVVKTKEDQTVKPWRLFVL